MLRKILLTCCLWTLIFVMIFPSALRAQILTIQGDLDKVSALADGNYSTVARGHAGTNRVILQFGQLKYLQGLRISGNSRTIKNITLQISQNFIEWSTIPVKETRGGQEISLSFAPKSALFARLEVVADGPFEWQEISTVLEELPENRVENLQTRILSENSVRIQWKTLHPSQGTLHYFKKYGGLKETIVEVDFKTDHEVVLKNLLRGTEYIFQVVSESPDGKKVEVAPSEFKTPGVPLPDFRELRADSISPYQGVFSFRANIPVTYEVFLGRASNSMEKTLTEKAAVLSNTIVLRGLQPETLYYYSVSIKDKFGNVMMTPALAFMTPPDNMALGKPVAGTFNFVEEDVQRRGYGTTSGARLVDGKLNYFDGMALSYQLDNADQYAVIDLGKPEPIRRIEVFWWALSYSRDYRLEVSLDGKIWTTVENHIDADKGQLMASPAGDALVAQTVNVKKTARFVRLYVSAKSRKGSKSKQWPARPNLYLSEIAIIRDIP